ncbi:hypothetical protein [Rhodococcus kronopolitis]|uniref:Uncharacterized protein n=1 Tax=Rhodococcus kronopolitis TaxID=1460226 RepID=A0ABV9FT83_9NOCA
MTIDPRVVRLGVTESIESILEVATLVSQLRAATETLEGFEGAGARLDQAAAALAAAADSLSGTVAELGSRSDHVEAGVRTYTAFIDPAGETQWLDAPDPLARASTSGRIRVVGDDDGTEAAVLPCDSGTASKLPYSDTLLFDAGWVRIGPWCQDRFCAVEPVQGRMP